MLSIGVCSTIYVEKVINLWYYQIYYGNYEPVLYFYRWKKFENTEQVNILSVTQKKKTKQSEKAKIAAKLIRY